MIKNFNICVNPPNHENRPKFMSMTPTMVPSWLI